MKIACNYYKETEELVDEGRIDIDYFKYPGLVFQMGIMEDMERFEEQCKRITSKRPILLHGLYPAPHDLSSHTLKDDFDFELVSKLINATKTPGLSFHPALQKINDKPFNEVLDTIIRNARFINEKYSNMDFVTIENGDNSRWGNLLKPDVIKLLLRESGCKFLLDISHAYCASRALNIDFSEYLKSLPLEDVYEVHINGWIEQCNRIMCHVKIHEEAYVALKEVLEYCTPEIITIEYGRDNDKLGAGIPLISPDCVNNIVKDEIEEQFYKIMNMI